jgi:hypothetical protein
MTGTILIHSKPRGIYTIKVVGTLPDLVTSTSADFTIIIENTAPHFSIFPLSDCLAPLMKL